MCSSDRHNTNRIYQGVVSLLKQYIIDQKWNRLPIESFSKVHALAYMDHCVEVRQIGMDL